MYNSRQGVCRVTQIAAPQLQGSHLQHMCQTSAAKILTSRTLFLWSSQPALCLCAAWRRWCAAMQTRAITSSSSGQFWHDITSTASSGCVGEGLFTPAFTMHARVLHCTDVCCIAHTELYRRTHRQTYPLMLRSNQGSVKGALDGRACNNVRGRMDGCFEAASFEPRCR